jgi:putative Holliday junction resolvase
MERILAIDLGEKRVGLAITSPLNIPRPLKTVKRKKIFEEISAILKNYAIKTIVVGFPLNMDGTEGDKANEAREFAREIKERFKIPVYLQDERLTSYEAKEIIRETGKKIDKGVIDRMAAFIILKEYLNEN